MVHILVWDSKYGNAYYGPIKSEDELNDAYLRVFNDMAEAGWFYEGFLDDTTDPATNDRIVRAYELAQAGDALGARTFLGLVRDWEYHGTEVEALQ